MACVSRVLIGYRLRISWYSDGNEVNFVKIEVVVKMLSSSPLCIRIAVAIKIMKNSNANRSETTPPATEPTDSKYLT